MLGSCLSAKVGIESAVDVKTSSCSGDILGVYLCHGLGGSPSRPHFEPRLGWVRGVCSYGTPTSLPRVLAQGQTRPRRC